MQGLKNILLIDDQPGNGEHTKDLLALSNFIVSGASGVREAGAIALLAPPDLVVCDVSVSGEPLYAVIRELQAEAVLHNIPLIVFTADPAKANLRRIMDLGADDCLVRPIESIELLRSVDACLERQRRRVGASRPAVSPSLQDAAAESKAPWRPGDTTGKFCKRKCLLYTEGQRALQVWYIIEGKVKTFRLHTDGKELITGIYGSGECVGYPAVIAGGVYSDNAQVIEDAEVIGISRSEFLRLLQSDGQLARQLVHWLAQRAGEKDAGLLNFAYSSLRKKVANGILSLAANLRMEQNGHRYITISRDNLAAYVGSAPESLTRTLGDFRKEGLIDVMDGRIWLLQEEKLKKMVN